MEEFKVGESSPWLLHIRHSDAWCSTADYISGPRGLQIGYVYDFTFPFFCGAFKYNWQHLKFVNKVKGHPHGTPAQAQRWWWRPWSALRPGRITPEADPVPTFISTYRVEFYEPETWSVTSKHVWMVCGVSTLRKTLSNNRKVLGGLRSLSETLFWVYYCLFVFGATAPSGQGPPHSDF